jgi:hypothetical protein
LAGLKQGDGRSLGQNPTGLSHGFADEMVYFT